MNKKSKERNKDKPLPHPHHHHHHQDKVQDVTKKSVLDVLRENMKIAQRVTYVHRLIYIGDHSFQRSDENGIQTVFQNVIDSINEKHCEEKLTGYILYYQKYFCVVIDGPEESLVKHLKILLHRDSKDPEGPKFGRLKLLVAYHHVNQRVLDEWMSTSGRPPTLLEKLNPNADLQQSMLKVRYVIEKLYNLGIAMRTTDEEQEKDECTVSESFTLLDSQYKGRPSTREVSLKKGQGRASATSEYADQVCQQKVSHYLPEYSVLEFLLSSPYTIELRNYPKIYGEISHLHSYQDLVWPIGCDFTPMNLQAKDVDPITELDPEVIPK